MAKATKSRIIRYKLIPASWLRRDVRGFDSPAAAHRWAYENGWGNSKYKVAPYYL